ncbi:MAG: tRNA (adenosine(37)-N6)-threonylcarbamoyltransferase complex ATPase subunit type 1 TsaE [Nitrospirota bacterium]
MIQFRTRGPDETKRLGFRIGKLLHAGDTVGLYGELGTGKTTLTKGIAQAWGISERDIVSASFTLVAEYQTVPPFIHIDLYRIATEGELDTLGLGEAIGGQNITVIEWAEKAAEWLPRDMIQVTLKILSEEDREITVKGLYEKDRHRR